MTQHPGEGKCADLMERALFAISLVVRMSLMSNPWYPYHTLWLWRISPFFHLLRRDLHLLLYFFSLYPVSWYFPFHLRPSPSPLVPLVQHMRGTCHLIQKNLPPIVKCVSLRAARSHPTQIYVYDVFWHPHDKNLFSIRTCFFSHASGTAEPPNCFTLLLTWG